jgi:hypothetical protein
MNMNKSELAQKLFKLKDSGSHYIFSNYLKTQLQYALIRELEGSDLNEYVQFRDYDYNIVPSSESLLQKLYAWISSEIVNNLRDDVISEVGNDIRLPLDMTLKHKSESAIKKMPKNVLENIYIAYVHGCERKDIFDRLTEHYKDILSEILENFRRETLCVYLLDSLEGVYPNGRIKEYQYYPIFNTFFDRKSDRTPEECKELEETEYKRRTEEWAYLEKVYANDNS